MLGAVAVVDVPVDDRHARQAAGQARVLHRDRDVGEDAEPLAGIALGRDAISKARSVLERSRQAIQSRNTEAVQEQVEGLSRTQRMFKGVVSRAQ